ncbi:MAG: hypothetical protein OXR62_13105 [Ahrensia sp.]|nr:hypothetical protein [Ahrensia sp.]
MSRKQQDAYWRRVWYAKRGQVPPEERGKAKVQKAQVRIAKAAVADPVVKAPPVEKADAPTRKEPAAKPKSSPSETSAKPVKTKVKTEAKTAPPAKHETEIREPGAIYDAGLKRPDFSRMTKREIKAYWTRVWYAKRDLRRAKRSGKSSG